MTWRDLKNTGEVEKHTMKKKGPNKKKKIVENTYVLNLAYLVNALG